MLVGISVLNKNAVRRKIIHNVNTGRSYRKLTRGQINPDSSNLLTIDRVAPGKGFRHFLLKKDILSFIELLPQWSGLSRGLTQIVLARGEAGCDGWYGGNVLAINAWERDLWRVVPPDYYSNHCLLFASLGVECIKQGRNYLCKFSITAVRAFQLLHVFLHELGHHYDKITTKKKLDVSRGELFAEQYAARYGELIWQRYIERFGL